MTQDEVIEMARQAGVDMSLGEHWSFFIEELEAFAKMVAAKEREACAKLVEPDEEHRRDASWGYLGGTEGVELLDGMAAAIRARSNT